MPHGSPIVGVRGGGVEDEQDGVGAVGLGVEGGGIRHAAVLQVAEAKFRRWRTIRMVRARQGSARWKGRCAWPSRPHAPGC